MEYVFTLKYRLPDVGSDPNELVELLGAAGCEDALVGTGQPGRIAIEFARESENATAAIVSALADVKRAIPAAKLIEVAPDFVGLTDVAEVVGMSRQNMRKLMVNHSMSFPPPIHDGSSAIWHLADILDWMRFKGTYTLESTMIEIAQTAMQINLAKDKRRVNPAVQRKIQALLA